MLDLLIDLGYIVAFVFAVIIVIALFTMRRVVATNEVHIVQSGKHTVSYGSGTNNGNVYYEWPSWIPLIGVIVTTLPVSVFDVSLDSYEAYDKDRVPFKVDIIGFFRIANTNLAAQRVSDFHELEAQLIAITQGAVRTVLASNDIDGIMTQRATFGEQFTTEVKDQLTEWGVEPVKNLELMDIRDAGDSKVILNIMQKKKSFIESESRQAVAKNKQTAEVAEAIASREIELQKQQAAETVGLRTAEKDQKVGIAQQQADQAIMEQHRLTKEKEMAVTRVAETQQAEITKAVNITQAEQAKQMQILEAEGKLEAKNREATAIKTIGDAEGAAETAKAMAPVNAQIALAKEIGTNEGYQKYLIGKQQIEANRDVGIEQAKALESADVKIIANTGAPAAGLTSIGDLFTAKGGMGLGAALEGLAQTDTGKALLNTVTGGKKAA